MFHNHNLSSRNHLILNIQINILINIIVLQGWTIPSNLEEFIDASLIKVRLEVTLILSQDLRLSLLATETVTKWCLDGDLIQHGTIVQGNGQCIGDGTLGRVVVVNCELRVLDTLDALAQVLDKRGRGGLGAVSVVGGCEAVEGEHGCDHVLDAVVAVGEVVHGFELLVDDADAGFVCAVGDFLDVLGGLAHLGEFLVDDLCGFDGGLGVELSWEGC